VGWIQARCGVNFPPFLVRKEVGVVVHFSVERRPRQDGREMGMEEIHRFVYLPRQDLLANF
jgi:hypothetical protein